MCCSGLFLVLLLCPHSSVSRLEHVLDSLHSMLTYYKSNPDLVDENLIFGVLLIKGELRILKQLDDEQRKNEVTKLIDHCDDLLDKHPYQFSITTHAQKLVERLGEIKAATEKTALVLPQLDYTISTNLEFGSPTRNDSDMCLLGILEEGEFLPQCDNLETDPMARGYTLLHQALYFTIKSHMKEEDVKAREITRGICGQILAENRQIMKMGFPVILQDLFAEQVAVCGLNKFNEFLTDSTLRMILSLQTSRGCFSLRERRQHLQIDCYTHLSAVSAVALATFIS